jgi:uncharacterized protein
VAPKIRREAPTGHYPAQSTQESDMALPVYDVSVATFIRGLTNLSAVLAKGEAYSKEQGKGDELVAARLFEDMLPLTKQVQIASDTAKGAAARLAGAEIPSFEDSETTFAELQARIAKTIDFLKTITAAQLEGSETRDIELAMRSGTLQFKGAAYLLGFALPNFYFHLTTAYDILRHNGVPLGKLDFLGAPKQ